MNGWLAKKSDNWLIQIYSYSVQSIFSMHAEHALSRGVWGHAPTENFANLAYSVVNLVIFLTHFV